MRSAQRAHFGRNHCSSLKIPLKSASQTVPDASLMRDNTSDKMQPLMNDTKWNELRLAMYDLDAQSPRRRTKNLESWYICRWDGEWFYHFGEGG